MEKRNVMISGNFELTEMQQVTNNTAAVTPTKKAQDRIDALKAHGIDTSNLFAMGEEMVVRVEGGIPTQVADDDPVWKAIMAAGTVPDRRLFRRWVLAQTFHMLRSDYTKAMHSKGYEYTWKMLEEELRVQSKLYGHDNENFCLRNRFFNRNVAYAMAHDYFNQLMEYVTKLKTRKCKGVPYKRIWGRDIFVADLESKLYRPVREYIYDIKHAKNAKELYKTVASFNKHRTHLHFDNKQCAVWVDAYKGAGAYYSMQNLIRFHGMFLTVNGFNFKGEKAIEKLNWLADRKQGWELLGILKEALEYNGIDIDRKIASWQK